MELDNSGLYALGGAGEAARTPMPGSGSHSESSFYVRSAAAGVFVVQRGRLRHVSEPVATLLGYADAETLKGGSFWDLIHPEDRHRIRIGRRNPAKEVSRDRAFYRALRKDGSPVWVDIQGGIVYLEDRPAFVGCMAAVATAQSSGGASALDETADPRSVVNSNLHEAVITVSPQMIVTAANPWAKIVCGIDAKEMVGRLFGQWPRSCGGGCARVLRRALEHQQLVRDHRVACGLPRHPGRFVSVSGIPLRSNLGNLLGAAVVLRDVTGLRLLERELGQRSEYHGLVGHSRFMQGIYRLVEDLADLDNTVLISGESGTGKKLVAKALHNSGRRAFGPFVSVNCSASVEPFFEKDLFGCARGAFKGADQDQPSHFERAAGGTLFLFEIGKLSPKIQLKLSRALQEKEYARVGDATPCQVTARVVASTSEDLRQKIKNGEFREDLYDRLREAQINLTPLRERPEDIPVLVDHLRKTFNCKFGKNIKTIESIALGLIMDYHWPGNVGELERVMEHAFMICDGERLERCHLPVEIKPSSMPNPKRDPEMDSEPDEGLGEILKALNRAYWNKSKAARLLGISRQTLYRKMHEYGLL